MSLIREDLLVTEPWPWQEVKLKKLFPLAENPLTPSEGDRSWEWAQ